MQTYWNGEPTPCRRVLARVREPGPGDPPMAWWRGLEGRVRQAVEVNYHGDVFYLDDDDLPEDQDERILERLEGLPRGQRRRIERLMKAMEMRFGKDAAGKGSGWAKVTHGRGSPQYGHRSLPVAEVVEVLEPDPAA